MKKRKQYLNLLYQNIEKYEDDLFEAFKIDLGKPKFETYLTEIGYIKRSIRHMIKNMHTFLKDEKVKTPLYLFGNKSKIIKAPLGKILIISSFNYPFQLLFEPLIGALASGNTAVCKPSEFVPNINQIIKKIIEETFDQDTVRFVEGDKDTTQKLLQEKFDLIFFTGSEKVGRIVYQEAAKTLTPVVLELGGKSPAVVYEDAKLDVIVDRIIWGKFTNAAQTCVAPDYVLVEENIKELFIQKCIDSIETMFKNTTHKIVTKEHAKRLHQLIDEHQDAIVYGGHYEERKIEPTLLSLENLNTSIMQEEIFGPIFPIISFKEDPKSIINTNPNPLALYVFTEDLNKAEQLIKDVSFGGGMINHTMLHLSNPNLPFGGVANSGMGQYHGKYSIDTFTHKKSIMTSSTRLNHKLLYPPFNNKLKFIRKILK